MNLEILSEIRAFINMSNFKDNFSEFRFYFIITARYRGALYMCDKLVVVTPLIVLVSCDRELPIINILMGYS